MKIEQEKGWFNKSSFENEIQESKKLNQSQKDILANAVQKLNDNNLQYKGRMNFKWKQEGANVGFIMQTEQMNLRKDSYYVKELNPKNQITKNEFFERAKNLFGAGQRDNSHLNEFFAAKVLEYMGFGPKINIIEGTDTKNTPPLIITEGVDSSHKNRKEYSAKEAFDENGKNKIYFQDINKELQNKIKSNEESLQNIFITSKLTELLELKDLNANTHNYMIVEKIKNGKIIIKISIVDFSLWKTAKDIFTPGFKKGAISALHPILSNKKLKITAESQVLSFLKCGFTQNQSLAINRKKRPNIALAFSLAEKDVESMKNKCQNYKEWNIPEHKKYVTQIKSNIMKELSIDEKGFKKMQEKEEMQKQDQMQVIDLSDQSQQEQQILKIQFNQDNNNRNVIEIGYYFLDKYNSINLIK